ncbi:hypothetical protein J3D55_003633 [Chryseobacterium ginsenosidimutans]|nr:hypothetical protein [Chryseobacterium ginsenosidimutans]
MYKIFIKWLLSHYCQLKIKELNSIYLTTNQPDLT